MENTYKGLPLIEEFINDVYALGVVQFPAIEVDFTKFSIGIDSNCYKVTDMDKQIISGPIMIPNIPIYRDDEVNGKRYVWFSEQTINDASLSYFRNYHQNTATLEHQVNMQGSTLYESWIIADTENDKSNTMGYKLPVETWFGSMKIEDKAVWDNFIKTGILKGFSIEMNPKYKSENKNNIEKMELKNILKFFSGKTVEEFDVTTETTDMSLFALDFISGESKVAVDDMWIATIDGALLPEGEIEVTTPDSSADYILEVGVEGKVLWITTPWGIESEAVEEVLVEDSTTAMVEEVKLKDESLKLSSEIEKLSVDNSELIKKNGELLKTISDMKLKSDRPNNVKSTEDKWVETAKVGNPNLKSIVKTIKENKNK